MIAEFLALLIPFLIETYAKGCDDNSYKDKDGNVIK